MTKENKCCCDSGEMMHRKNDLAGQQKEDFMVCLFKHFLGTNKVWTEEDCNAMTTRRRATLKDCTPTEAGTGM